MTIKDYGSTRTIIDGNNRNRIFNINSGATLDLINLTIINSKAANGGVFYINGGKINIINCSFYNNTATSNGGVIFVENGEVRVYDSKFLNNIGKHGSTIFNKGSLSIINSTFEYNVAEDGKTIYINNVSNFYPENRIFYNNTEKFRLMLP
ncbi:hypothetical protein ALNOE001_16870 [Candidatus Methanobinarius endosymbioticus]|uniref:Right handed beta helix domain-containing protein n=1 Tax=Candidatus Methanobinarius endosymbioticus TaxID=2006182 RepID=A0A366MA77_9EURY|nr:hypothetical protein ALNOE001_16870 [Candidatus Methanobinarius endosymbioticus]